MAGITLAPEDRREAQRVDTVSVEAGVVTLSGRGRAIRFPAGWARKLRPWAEGPARNIMCTADLNRFNLVGVTKAGNDLTFSYVGPDGDLRGETVSRRFLPHLEALLRA